MDPRAVLLLAIVASAYAVFHHCDAPSYREELYDPSYEGVTCGRACQILAKVPIDVSRFNEDTACARTCSGSSKFSYESGKTYNFLYETETRTGIEGASEDKSSLLMMVNVHVEVISPCEYVLKMEDVRLMEIDPESPSRPTFSPKTREFKQSLEAYPLRFGFQDGRIESVCPNDGDPVWIVNIKRGVLSTFQNVMDSLDRDQRVTETDVAGECDAEYKVINPRTRWSSSTTVRKSKNLIGCRNRHGYNSAVQAIPYHVQSDIQSLPLMKSNHQCDQEINEGRLISATCKETHVFRPFSKGSNGAVTETTQKLKFQSEKSGARSRPDFISRRSDLHFEHTDSDGSDRSDAKDQAEEKLRKLCRLTHEDIRPETPQLFADLVHLMRHLEANSLRDLYRKVQSDFCRGNEERTRKFFMDAIPMVGTKASVGMIENLISKGIVEGIESDVWVTSLAFVANPTREMLTEVKPLLRSKPTGHVMLSISALVNNYCRVKPCENDIEVDDIVSILEENLGSQCDIRGNDAEKILLSLRAIGNTGHAEKAVPTLNRCFAKEDLPMEIRLSAVNAFRHMSCKADLNNIMALFRNKKEDSELRIAAYLSVIECPTDWVLEQVKETLESEEVNQVGSFVWSHLTNLMETSDPHKQAIRAILEDETLAKEFDMDKRKFSRNYEGSIFSEKLNAGAKAESNIIWSSKSFLPRSAMVNLTVDLFGHAINLIEIGGRVEGLEYYLESLFGPQGVLQNPEAKDAWKRSKRQVVRQDKLDRIKQRYGITSDEVAGSMYFRMFGNELAYMSMGGPNSAKKRSPNIMDMLLKLARQNSYQMTQNIMFMDSSIVIPTAVGIPLRLTVNGTATVDLKVSGKMDVRKITSRPSNMHIEGIVQPSGAVEVASTMVVDAYLVRSGLKMVTTLHSSTAANGKLEVKNGQVINVEFDSPRDKMEILNLNTKFFVLHREAEREQRMIDVNRKAKTACSGDLLAKLTGMEICGSLGFTNASSKDRAPYFPLTGPLSVGINLYKRDTHSGYIFSAKYSSDPNRKSARVSFDTPGGRENRQLVSDVELDLKDKDLQMNLVTPWKKATVKGSVINNDGLKRASLRVVVDRQSEYSVNGEVKIDRSDKRVKYIPLLEISAPSVKTMTVGGTVEKVGQEALEVDISMQNIFRNPINLRSAIVNNEKEKSYTGSFSNGKSIYTAIGKVLIKSEKKASAYNATLSLAAPRAEFLRVEAFYEKNAKKNAVRLLLDKVVANPMKLEGSIGTYQTKRSNKHAVRLDVETPLVSLDVNGFVDRKKGRKSIVTSKATVNYQLPNRVKDRVIVSSKTRNLSTKSLSKYDIVLNTNFKKNSDYNFESSANLELSSTNMDTSFELQYGDNPKNEDKKITLTQSGANRLRAGKRDSNLKVSLKYPAKNINCQLKATHLHTNEDLDSNVVIRYGGKDINANLKLNNDMTRKNSMSGEVALSYPGRRLRATTQLNKVNDKQYNNTIDLVWGKGGKAKIETTYLQPTSLSHKATTAIHVAGKGQVILSGDLNRDPKNLQISSSVTTGKKKYEVGLSHKKTYRKYEAQVDVKYPTRHIVADVDADWRNKYTGTVDIKWDADTDKSRRFKADGDLDFKGIQNIRGSVDALVMDRKVTANIRHQSSDKHISHLDVKYAPGKVIAIDTTFGDSKGWSNRRISGSVRLVSPYRFARLLEVNAEHSIDSLQFETVADVSWSPTDKVEGTLTIKRPISLRRLETTLSVATTIPQYRKISGEINHRIEGELSTAVKAQAGRHSMDISLTASNRGTDDRRDASAELTMKSSIRDLENVVISASHNDDGRKFDSSLTADVGRHGRYSLDVDMTHDGYSYHMSNTGKVTITTPIRHFDKIIAAWSHRCRENSIESSLSCNWDNQRLSVKVNGNHQSNYHQRLISGTVDIESPVSAIRELVLTVNHDHKRGELQSSASMVRNRYKRTEYAVSYTINDDSDIESTAMFTCPGINVVKAKLSTKLSNTPRTAEAELEWSPTEKMTLSGELTRYQWRYLDSTVRLTSPFERFERIVLSAHHAKDDGVWISNAALEYAPRREINIRTRLSKESRLLAEIKIQSPFYQFQKFEMSAEHSGEIARATSSKASVELQPQLGKIEAVANFENGREMSGNARVDTPFRAARYSQASFTYRPGKAHIEVEYLPNQVVNVDTEYRLDDSRDLAAEVTMTTPISSFDYIKTSFLHRGSWKRSRSVVSVEYPRKNTFSATANYENDDKIEASVDLRAPEYDDVRLSVTHSGTPRAFNSHGEITYQRYKKIEGDVNFSLRRGMKGPIVSLVTVAKSPYTEDVNLKLNHEGNIVDFKTKLVGSYGRPNRLTYNLGFSSSDSSLKADTDFDLQSKYTDHHSASAALNLEGELKNFKSTFDGSYKDQSVNTAVSVNLRDGIESSFTLNTPFETMRNIDATLKHSGQLREFQSNAKLVYNRKEFEGDLIFSSRRDHLNSKIIVKTPFAGYRDLTSTLRFDGNLQNMRTSSNIEIEDGREIRMVGNLDLVGSNRKFDVTVHTPFQDYETISASGNFTGEPTRFEMQAHVQYATRSRIELSSKFKMGSRRKELEAILLSPFYDYERLSVSGNIDGELNHFTSSASIEYARDKKIEGTVRSDMEGKVKEISVNVKTPFRKFRETSVSGRVEGNLMEFSSTASVQYLDGQRISLSSTADFSRNPKSITADLRTPFQDFEEVSLVGNFNGYSKHFRADSQFSLGRRSRFNLDADVDLEGDKKKISGSVRTPFAGYEQLSIEGQYGSRSSRHSADVSLEYAPNKKIELDGSLTMQRERKNIRASIKTPFEGFEEISVRGNFNGNMDKFECDGEVELAPNRKIQASGSLDIASSTKSLSASLKTPYIGFKDQSLRASVSGELKRCELEGQVSYGDRKTVTLNGAVDVVSSPVSVNGRIATPYPGYETQAFAINFDGKPLDFKTSATIESSQLPKPILARATVMYRTPTDMDAVLTFTSAIRNAESLKLVVKNKDEQQYSSHVEAMWAPRRSIEMDGTFEQSSRWRKRKSAGELSISTPFEGIRKAGISFEDNSSSRRRNAEVSIDYENRKLLTLKANRVVDGQASIDLGVSSPRPMKLQAKGVIKPEVAEATVFADWDSRDPRSNVKVTVEYNDAGDVYSVKKDASIMLIHPEHSVGVTGKLEKSTYNLISSGEVTWNKKKVSVESEFRDQSQGYTKMYNGKVKLNTPYRSVQLEGSHSDDVHKINDVVVASWDVNRDESKKIILSSMIQKLGGKHLKTDFKVEVPSVGKELRVVTESTTNSGRTLFDGKSEVFYSSDSRKKLTIKSKIEDTSSGYGDDSNYTLTLSLMHPSTNTDIRMISHAGKTENHISAAAEVDYLSSRRKVENLRLRGEIDRLRKRANLEIVSPVKSVEITGKLQSDAGYHLSLHNVYDKSSVIDTSISIDPEKGNVLLTMGSDMNDPRKTVNLKAGFQGDKIFSLEAFHVSRHGRVTDGLMALTLNTSRILHTRLHWRPEVITEIKAELDRRSRIYQHKVDSSLREAVRDLAQEWDSRQRLIDREIRQDLNPILDLIRKEWNAVDLELAQIMQELNELGLQEALVAVQDAMNAIMKLADETLLEMSRSYSETVRKIQETWDSVHMSSAKYREILQASAELLKEYYAEVEQFVEDAVRDIVKEIERLAQIAVGHYTKVELAYRNSIRSAREYSSDLRDRILTHPKVQWLKTKYSDLISKIPDLPTAVNIKALSKQVQDSVKTYSRSAAAKYSTVVEKAVQKVAQTIKSASEREEVKRAQALANEVYQQGKWAYNYWEVEKNAVELAKSLVKTVRELVSSEIKELRDSILNLDKSRVIVYDPQHGEIQLEMYLPVAVKSLRKMPESRVPKYVKAYKKFANSYIPSRNFSVYDTYYSLKPTMDVANWVPPFKAHASISGKQHFTTFDGRHFDFAGLCSYVLAHDFMDGNFSVILNYDGDWVNFRKRSLTITTGTKTIDIFPDYKIHVDKRPQELPYEFESTTVKRDGSLIRVDSGNGVEVECDLAHDIYTVTISGWYYGKTAGLFGTYDNEPYNDLVTSSQETTKDIQSFADSWEVGGHCRSSRNFAKPALMEESQPGFRKCSSLFRESTSPYRHCFKQVDPMAAMAKCMEDHMMEVSEWTACNATAQYIRECTLEGVPLTMPPECVRCESPNGGIYRSGEDLILSEEGLSAPRSSDIVFVVEEKECNKEAAEDLQTLATSIESALRRNRVVNNRFGIVGFGGSKSCNGFHTHTIDGQIMNEARRFGIGARALRFDTPGENTDVLGAIKFASQYPFRAGVSKSIVLMSCSSCEVRDTSYTEIHKLLTERGIHLHLLIEHDFEFQSNKSPKSTNVFGIDKNGAFTYQAKRAEKAGDSKLLDKLRVPRNKCVSLSQNTKGTMFNVARMIQGRSRMQKSFRDVWSRQIALSAEPMGCQECKCQADENGVGMSVCTRCDQSTVYTSAIQSLMPNSRQETRPTYDLPDSEDGFKGELKGYLNAKRQ